MNNWLANLIVKLVSQKYYGKLILNFESGKITYVKKEETLKPPKD